MGILFNFEMKSFSRTPQEGLVDHLRKRPYEYHAS
jgi:hypothetical protein